MDEHQIKIPCNNGRKHIFLKAGGGKWNRQIIPYKLIGVIYWVPVNWETKRKQNPTKSVK
jgi:hypothetical protein